MKLNVFFILLFSFVLAGAVYPTDKKPPQDAKAKAKAVIDYYKKKVDGIILKGEDKVIRGRIKAFRGKGIVFDPEKSGPFYNPPPQYYPINKVQAFIDANGEVVWGHTTVKTQRDYLKIRRYKFLLGAKYGFGRHQRSYTFEPLVPDGDYVQELQSGNNIIGQAAWFFASKYSIGVKYIRHATGATLYGLQPDSLGGGSTNFGTINDDIVIQNIMLDFGFHQSITRKIIFHANVAAGVLMYNNDRRLSDGAATITATTGNVYTSAGFDFLLHRNVGIGFDLGLLFGSVKNPTVTGEAQIFEGQQSMNRFDINIGVNFLF